MKKVIAFEGYIQGKEFVENFRAGLYDIKIKQLSGGEDILRVNILLKVPGGKINFLKEISNIFKKVCKFI